MRWLVIDHNREDCYIEKFKLFGTAEKALKHAKSIGWGKGMGTLTPTIPSDPGSAAVFRHGCETNLEVVCLLAML